MKTGPNPDPDSGSHIPEGGWTKEQLCFLQGDMMVFVPELAALFTEPSIRPGDSRRRDSRSGLMERGDNGRTPRGLIAGWVWTTYLQWYSSEDRQRVYDKVKQNGWTHVVLHVGKAGADGGYHDMRPTTQEEADSFGERSNVCFREIVDNGLIPIAIGVSSKWPAAPGFDCAQVQVAITNYDDSRGAAAEIKAISDTFPNAWLFYERPGPDEQVQPDFSGVDPVRPTADNGGQWILWMQRFFPRFVGVLYEVSGWMGLDACVAELNRVSYWYRDLQQGSFESWTFEQYWENASEETVRAFGDALLSHCPQLVGRFGGASAVERPSAGDSTNVDGGQAGADAVDVNLVTFVGAQLDTRSFAKTVTITRLDVTPSVIHVEFTPDGWPEFRPPGWTGDLQFSMGLGFQVDGQWYAAAPLECYKGMPMQGGGIMNLAPKTPEHPEDREQIPANWFDRPRWNPLAGRDVPQGTQMIFYVIAGSERNGIYMVRERSNIITFTMPGRDESVKLQWAS